ncbi:MAG: NAD(P)H-dependent oxidoreductase [Acidimicrobiia bacterium]|nr:NAD(P)H-dependent oxidoreductase [Acidimicrobiia bacterium]
MLDLKIIIGSTREGRSADQVHPWVVERARAHEAFDVEVLDLRDWPLPMFAETIQTVGDFRDPTYSDPIVKRWNQTIKAADAFLFITTEYNHSVPGVLKNAIDSVFVSYGFRNKPSATVSYSNSLVGGARAIEHLAHMIIEADGVPLRNTVPVGRVLQAFDEDGMPHDPMTDVSLGIVLDDLAWWGTALQKARADGELPPGTFRLRAAMAAQAKG